MFNIINCRVLSRDIFRCTCNTYLYVAVKCTDLFLNNLLPKPFLFKSKDSKSSYSNESKLRLMRKARRNCDLMFSNGLRMLDFTYGGCNIIEYDNKSLSQYNMLLSTSLPRFLCSVVRGKCRYSLRSLAPNLALISANYS